MSEGLYGRRHLEAARAFISKPRPNRSFSSNSHCAVSPETQVFARRMGAVPDPESGRLRETVLSIAQPEGQTLVTKFGTPSDQPIRALDECGNQLFGGLAIWFLATNLRPGYLSQLWSQKGVRWAALALVAIRHAARPAPSILQTAAGWRDI